jgi:hypothetical protein
MGVNKSVFLFLMMLHTKKEVSNTATTHNVSKITAKLSGA